ncbi:hypothetical protein [Gordonia alkaliphila]|uniref:Helix-turn-helix DNA binding domain protein n=1 Tax=Gordonia alkaliphila TaxID=1053547 RepID=A0ABP8ZKK5_9ACTN
MSEPDSTANPFPVDGGPIPIGTMPEHELAALIEQTRPAPTDFNEATVARAQALDTLILLSESIAGADDYGDMIGAVRMVELAAQQARRAIIAEARASGETWQSIGDALGISRQAAHERYA